MPPAPAPRRIDAEAVAHAAADIDPVFRHTPQLVCESIAEELGAPLAVKVETLNPVRSFKGRGADLLAAERQRRGDRALVCASAGNFGLALAYACRSRGVRLTVYASRHANRWKLAGIRRLGAEVVQRGEDFDAAKEAARGAAAAQGAPFVEDGEEVATLLGAGTLAVEWFAGDPPCDTLLVPLGNGALLAGVACVVKDRAAGTRVVAVQAAAAPAMTRSLREGRVVTTETADTIADGIAVRVPVPAVLGDLAGLVDDAVLVGEAAIPHAMRLLHRHLGVVVEPAGAVGVAALLEHPRIAGGGRVGTVLTGGNLTEEQVRTWLCGA
jgi:threonine dehydratase